MSMFKYILKRIGLMFLTFMIIMTICFTLIKLLQPELPMMGLQADTERARREALGYNKPIMVQYGIYLRNIATKWDWGTSWKIDYMSGVGDVLAKRLPPTVIMNVYSVLLSIPIGIALGIVAAIFKNKWLDHAISTIVMLFISVPSFVYAFLLQYFMGFKLGAFPVMVSSLYDAGGSWFSGAMLNSMVLPVLSLSFGIIAGLARFTRAELTEALTSEYMLLARAKGLTKNKAIARHALQNAMVPILPMILAEFLGVLVGSIIIEQIFVVNGIGKLYIQSIRMLDYDVFVATGMFYTLITLASIIVIDLSYGFIDPRIRMGEK
ncbi:MAG: ABC transporter permease [Clostridiaceae bacterium]|nr:ABC transporter permease [Eubacteriales bacterium]